MSARILASSLLAIVVSTALARAQIIGPIPYTSTASSPWNAGMFAGYFHLENCEDSLFNVPGVTASQGFIFADGISTDSVDGDDGSVDGSGLTGHSFLVAGSGNPVGLFTFHSTLLGAYPTHAGIVVTDAHNPVFVEGFRFDGVSLGVVTLNTFGPPPDVQGQTGEDRFVGFVFGAGIRSLRVSTLGQGGLEIDHLQYAHDTPIVGTMYCPGDGTGTACPCGNSGGTASGCANSVNPAGGALTASGIASVSADSLTLSGNGMTNSSVLYFQGTTQASGGAGVVFGDGKRCVTGTVKRLYVTSNTNGSSQVPSAGMTTIAAQGSNTPGAVRQYQGWYRDAAPAYCTPATFTLTNGLQVVWGP